MYIKNVGIFKVTGFVVGCGRLATYVWYLGHRVCCVYLHLCKLCST